MILLAVWSFLRAAGVTLIDPSDIKTGGIEASRELGYLSETGAIILIAVIAFFMIGIDILIRVYIGTSAVAVSRGEKRSILFIILTCLIILGDTAIIIGLIATLIHFPGDSSVQTIAINLIIEVTSIVLMIGLIIAAVRVRRMRKQGN